VATLDYVEPPFPEVCRKRCRKITIKEKQERKEDDIKVLG